MRSYILKCFLFLLCLPVATAAQPPQENGYAMLVKAGELAKDNKALERAIRAGATLSVKREALRNSDLNRALVLVRRGLERPIQLPERETDAPFPDFALLRQLGRLLMVEQYVLMADGKTEEAVSSLRDGLRIGYMVQSETLIGSLVGIAIDSLVVRSFARHLPQLSARDCERLLALANEWLAAPDPTPRAMEAEKAYGLKQLDQMAPPPIKDEVRTLMSQEYDRVLAALRLPLWERPELKPVEGDSTAAQYVSALWENLRPAISRSMDAWTRDLAQIQLLGVHAAIRRYQWEYDRLPGSLNDLQIGNLALDPFTGKPLLYRVRGESAYDLYSAGPWDQGNENMPPSGQRVPLYLERRTP